MVELLKGWGSLTIAALALIQPWLIALWKKFYRKGTIDIHETGTIEVGYSAFGATIGLHGTLHAVHRDQFVRSIELTVVKLKDSSRHLFEWGVFRAQKWSISGAQEMSLELPSGFMVTVAQPYRYNILFLDRRVQDEIRPHIEKVRASWTNAVLEAGARELLHPGADIPTINAAIRQVLDGVYNDFSRGGPHVGAFTALDRLCYWEPGRYSLETRVNTARPNRTFARNWEFELSDAELESLRLNALKVVEGACDRPSAQYNFAYPRYGQ